MEFGRLEGDKVNNIANIYHAIFYLKFLLELFLKSDELQIRLGVPYLFNYFLAGVNLTF